MYECYDCGESFHGYGDCPSCGSVNVGMLDDDYDIIDDIEDDELEEFENDEEINEALRDIDYDDEDFDEDFE